jgi:leucine dehydrogenase
MTALASEKVLAGGYEEVRRSRGPRSGLEMAIAVHRTVGGRSLGGCRIEPYDSAEDALNDVKRLARSMTFKAAVAGLGLGGGKGVIALPPGAPPERELRERALHDFADLVESLDGRYITAQDAGTSLEDISYIGSFTDYVVGRPVSEGGAGDPGPYTAHGIEVAMQASLGGPLANRHVVILGLGHVGSELARRLHSAGSRLTLSDIDPAKRTLADQLGAKWCAPEQALVTEADVFAPCALSGVLGPSEIAALRVPIVAGAANNQLVSDDGAEKLRRRGIVWAPDFVINAGGLIAVSDELHGFNRARVERSIERIGDTLQEIFVRAADADTNTLVAAQELAVERSGGLDDDDH